VVSRHARVVEPGTDGDGGRLFTIGAAILLAVLSAVLVLVTIHRAPGLSPFDEATHADYAYEVSHGHIPEKGSLLSPEIRYEWSCHGTSAASPPKLPVCGTKDAPASAYPPGSKFPTGGGQNYNWGHPPLYYAITGVLARALSVGSSHGFITAGRVVGIGWLWAALLAMFLAGRGFGMPKRYAVLTASALLACPSIIYACSTLSNDAAAPLGGALALLLLARVTVQRKLGWMVPVVITAVVTATKIINALPEVIAALAIGVLAVVAWRSKTADARLRARQLAIIAASMLVTFLVIYKGWAFIQDHRGVADWQNPVKHGAKIVGSPINELLSTTLSGVQLPNGYYLPPGLDTHTLQQWVQLLTAVLAAGPLIALASYRRYTPGWTLAVTTLVGMLAWPLVVEIQIYQEFDLFFSYIQQRYGMSMIPLAVALVGLVVCKRRAIRVTSVFVGLGLLITLTSVTGLLTV
jgi:hypothetical protein